MMEGRIYFSKRLRLNQLGDFWPEHFHPHELTAGLYKRALCFYFPEVFYAFDADELLDRAKVRVEDDPAYLIILEISTRDPEKDKERLAYLYYELSETLRQLYYEDEEREIEKYTLRIRLVRMEEETKETEAGLESESRKALFLKMEEVHKWMEAEKCLREEWPLIIRGVKESSGDPDLAFRARLSGLKLQAIDAEGDNVKFYIAPLRIQWQEVLMELEGTDPDRYLQDNFREAFTRCIGDFLRTREIADVKNPEIIFDHKPEELPFI